MRKIYIDTEFKCHTTNPDGVFREIETDAFEGMCDEAVEGFRFVPKGESWTRGDGTVFFGEMASAWKDYSELDAAQREYERKLISEYESALDESVRLSDLDAAYQEGVNATYDR